MLKEGGVDIHKTKSSIQIRGQYNNNYLPIKINTYDDHRIAMSFWILGCYYFKHNHVF